ncbi:3'(2'),5'-bisphosphate nucleotidase CysQ [Bacteroidota bacterium]
MTENLLLTGIKAAFEAGEEILRIYSQNDFEIETKENETPLTLADKSSHKIINKFLSSTNIPLLSEEGKEIPFETRKKWDFFWLIDPLDGTKEFIKRNGEFTVNIALVKQNKPVLGIIYCPVLKELFYGYESIGSFKLNNLPVHITELTNLEILLKKSIKLSASEKSEKLRLVVSRSHMSKETEEFINSIKNNFKNVEYTSIGSSLKLCLVAEAKADIYPRFGPTMEWDTAAGHAIAKYAGCSITLVDEKTDLVYNKENLLNPFFIVKSKKY